jgi:hypothetical protein
MLPPLLQTKSLTQQGAKGAKSLLNPLPAPLALSHIGTSKELHAQNTLAS